VSGNFYCGSDIAGQRDQIHLDNPHNKKLTALLTTRSVSFVVFVMRRLNQIPRVPLGSRRERFTVCRVRLLSGLSAARALLFVNARFWRRRAGRETCFLSHQLNPYACERLRRSDSPHMGARLRNTIGTGDKMK
jgi:hypothetical protein